MTRRVLPPLWIELARITSMVVTLGNISPDGFARAIPALPLLKTVKQIRNLMHDDAHHGDYASFIPNVLYRRIGSVNMPSPADIDVKQASTGAFDTLRVRMNATIREQRATDPGRALVLQEGNSLFEARIEQEENNDSWPSFQPGTRIRVTGVCCVHLDRTRSPDGFSLLMHSPADIEVVARPPLEVRDIFLVLTILVCITTALLAWVIILRQEVLQTRK